MREEKQMVMGKIQTYERQIAEQAATDSKLKDMEAALGKLQEEVIALREEKRQHEAVIAEQGERLDMIDTLQDKVRALERENSELKAAKLMSMFNGGSANGSLLSSLSQARGATGQAATSGQASQIEQLRVQLSEKTNEYLKIKDENEGLRLQVKELIEKHDNEK
jgi:hypothetical protein